MITIPHQGIGIVSLNLEGKARIPCGKSFMMNTRPDEIVVLPPLVCVVPDWSVHPSQQSCTASIPPLPLCCRSSPPTKPREGTRPLAATPTILHSAEQVSVFAYVGSSKNLKDLKDSPRVPWPPLQWSSASLWLTVTVLKLTFLVRGTNPSTSERKMD